MSVRECNPQAARMGGGPAAAAVLHHPPRGHAGGPGLDRRVRSHGRGVAALGHRLGHGRAPSRRSKRVPDGRVRDDVGVLCAELAEDLLAHLRVHNWTYDPVEQRRRARRAASGVAAERPARRDAAPPQLHVLADEVRRREPGDPSRARPVGRVDVPRHLAPRQPARRKRQPGSRPRRTCFRRRTLAPRTSATSSRG